MKLERDKKKKELQMKEQAKLLEIEAKIQRARERMEQKKSQKKDAVRMTKYTPKNDDLSAVGFGEFEADSVNKGNQS